MFEAVDLGGPIRQAEIIGPLIDYVFDPETNEVSEYQYEYGLILSQDCDLERFHEDDPEAEAPVLIFPAGDAETARAKAGLNSNIWRQTRQNNNPRYHVIQECPGDIDTGGGIPHLMIDFRRFFVLQHTQIKKQIDAGAAVRRVRLCAPYREHLQSRAMFYLSRVPLDPPHEVP